MDEPMVRQDEPEQLDERPEAQPSEHSGHRNEEPDDM